MERIDRLEKAVARWRLCTILAISGMLALGGYAFSQRDQKAPPVQPAADAANFPIDHAPIPVTYTNFVRLSLTPEEVILDLGLNTQLVVEPKEPIRMSNRVVMNYYAAKRMSNALIGVVQHHEATYGPIELDYQNRMLPGAKGPGAK
jgi:Protein of unknown function (DUF3467)